MGNRKRMMRGEEKAEEEWEVEVRKMMEHMWYTIRREDYFLR